MALDVQVIDFEVSLQKAKLLIAQCCYVVNVSVPCHVVCYYGPKIFWVVSSARVYPWRVYGYLWSGFFVVILITEDFMICEDGSQPFYHSK